MHTISQKRRKTILHNANRFSLFYTNLHAQTINNLCVVCFRHIAPHWPTVKPCQTQVSGCAMLLAKDQEIFLSTTGGFPGSTMYWSERSGGQAEGHPGTGSLRSQIKKDVGPMVTAILYKTVVSLAWKLSLKRVSIETNLFQQNYTTLKMNKVNWPMWLESVGIFMLA
jgi:hypothetical protein